MNLLFYRININQYWIDKIIVIRRIDMPWWGQLIIFLFGFYVGFFACGLLVIAKRDREDCDDDK
jgi:hypothetical protein